MKILLLTVTILSIMSGYSKAEEKTPIVAIKKLNANDTLVYIPESKNHVANNDGTASNLAYIRAGHVFEKAVPVEGEAINAIVVMNQYTFDCSLTKALVTSAEVTSGKQEVYNYTFPYNTLHFINTLEEMLVLYVACDMPISASDQKVIDEAYPPESGNALNSSVVATIAKQEEQPEPNVKAINQKKVVQQSPESSKVRQENNELSRYKAKDALDEANKRINVMWKETTKAVRSVILPEQREWLKQRENDCELKATSKESNDTILQDTIRFNCMTAMTNQRIEVLKQKISSLTEK